jgi:uncharacterized protein YdcH (DUF465 family)
MTTQTPASAELKSDLEFLTDEVRRLHTQWDCFEQLFRAPGRTMLRNHADHFLTALNVALATDMVMTVCRFCDPVETLQKENLVFKRFIKDYPQLKPKIGSKVDELTKVYKSEIQPVRHKRLAHNGLLLLRGKERISAPTVTALRKAIHLCDDIVSTLYFELTGRLSASPVRKCQVNWTTLKPRSKWRRRIHRRSNLFLLT